MDFNKVIIVGRLTRDPEVRTTTGGQSVATVSVATGRTYTNKAGEKQDKTEFHNVVVWGRLAEICGQYLVKGQEVLFEGRLETRVWEGQDGQKRSRTEIIAENMQLGSKGRGGEGGNYQPRPNANKDSAPAPESEPLDEEEIKIEDIPF
jgi:single-strand DNA-binding protein